jgi:uncharacterized membrane protein
MSNHRKLNGPAAVYEHKHPPVRNVNTVYEKERSPGQRVADTVASLVGSWPFIITQSCFLVLWMATNVYLLIMTKTHPGFLKAWDPYPFILLNLVLSFQAAYTGPVVMMSQNRQNEKDRLAAQQDFEVNQRAEEEIAVMMKELVYQDQVILDVLTRLDALKTPPPEVQQRLDELQQQIQENNRSIKVLVERLTSS